MIHFFAYNIHCTTTIPTQVVKAVIQPLPTNYIIVSGGAPDFVVSMLADNKHGMLFMLTKSGYLLIHEAQSGKPIFNRQVTQTTFFVSGTNNENGTMRSCVLLYLIFYVFFTTL